MNDARSGQAGAPAEGDDLAGWVRGLLPGADAALVALVNARAAPDRVHWSKCHIGEQPDELDEVLAPWLEEDQTTRRARGIARLRGVVLRGAA